MSTFWINAGFLSVFLIPFDKLNFSPTDETTVVQVVVGAGIQNEDINSGGSVPHVALWDERGERIGQYEGNEDGHWKPGTVNEIVVKHKQNGNEKADPHYLSLVAIEKDAICVSIVSVSGNGADWGWTGDLAKKYGNADWYPSSKILGDGTSAPLYI